jgi:hypothetical protein
LTAIVLLPIALVLSTIELTSTVPSSVSGRPRTLTEPSEAAPAWEAAAGELLDETLKTGLYTDATVPRAAGRADELSKLGTLAGDDAGVTVCSPYAVPSALIGVTTTFEDGEPDTVELVRATEPTRMS